MGSMSAFQWMIAFAIIGVPIYIIANAIKGGDAMFCTSCGTEAPTKLRTKGSIMIEIVLWLMLLLPGLIYSIWRHTTRAKVCSACGSEHVVPPDSPMARKLRSELGGDAMARPVTTPAESPLKLAND